MRYGVIGTGWITEAFIASADAVGGMELDAVYSRSFERGTAFLNRLGRQARVVTSLEELAMLPVDGVYVASPNRLHYEQCRTLLSYGKHVLCEKPAAVETEQICELQRLAADKGLVYMEALMMLYLPQRQLVKEALGRIGAIHSAHIDFSQRSSKYDAYLRGETPNIFNPRMATGGLMDLGIYCVYPVLDWFGVPDHIQAHARFLRTGADHSGAALLSYPDMEVTLTYSKVGQAYAGSEIIGDQGSIRIGSISQLAQIRQLNSKGEAQLLVGDKDRVFSMAGEAAAFKRYVESGEQLPESELLLMRQVAQTMAEIRRQAKIVF